MCVWGGAGNKQSNILPKFQVFFYRSLPRVWCAERNIQRLFRVAGRRMESALRRFRPTLSADATPSRRPFLHSATHDFSFRLILYQLEEEKALPPKVAYYGILYRIFPLSRAAAAANPARGPSFPPLLAFREDVGVLSVYQTYKKARQGDCAKTKNGESVMKNGCG